ncbi:MAG: autotransporter-associated beta strand repeat-containing protein [Verrucomicrobia bacterium]|nr:autotransporter-associated beta strand repeat-containing protein [Verrucomicrobiota bacterium]
MGWTTMRNGVLAAAMAIAVGAQAQTTNAWVPGSGTTANWNTDSNWDPADGYPNSSTVVALFTNAYTDHITNTLSGDVTVNGIFYDDKDGTASQALVIQGGNRNITYAGTDPFIRVNNGGSGIIKFYNVTSVVNGATLTLWAEGGSQEFYSPIVGNGTLYVNRGEWSFFSGLPGFTGDIIISNASGTSVNMDSRAGDGSYTGYGDTNGATYIYREGAVRVMRDAASAGSVRSNAEPFHVYGVNNSGTIQFYNQKNTVYYGPITLHTNGVISSSQWFADPSVGERRDMRFEGTILDDGNARNVHFLHNNAGATTTGTLTRLTRIVFGGTGSYGGFTHVTSNKDPTGPDQYTSWLELTNGNDRLPVGTTVYLGGMTNSDTLWVGANGGNGALILAGANQELAGLKVLGVGAQNRVMGGAPTNNTLTLSIAAGTTNLYRGYLGGDGNWENNLSLTKKGSGLLHLTAVSNTYSGPTTVEAGTLQVDGSHPGGSAIAVQNSATLVMNGDWRNGGLITVDNGGTLGGAGQVGSITSSGTVAPGNSPGTLTSYGNVTLAAGATLVLELQDPLTDPSDALVLNGGILNLGGSPGLSLVLYGGYMPNVGDMFTIISGFADFDPGLDGTFSGKPDLGTFDVSGTTFQIDYSKNDITVTVVPEPQTLGLLGLAALGGLLRRRMRG